MTALRTTWALLAAGLAIACQAQPGASDFEFGPGDESGSDGAGADGGAGGSDGGADDGAADGADGGSDGGSDGGTGGAADDDNRPHAQATIAIGETHAVGGSTPTPSVTASFVPDFGDAQAQCAQAIGTCQVITTPVCEAGCGVDEVCGWDEGCLPSCQPVCNLACGTDEECYFPVPGSPACKKVEEFDGGALTFSGLTVPVTLYPPYAFVGQESGSLFVPGGDVTVNGSGAAAAGFDAFQANFTATDYLVSNLDSVDPADAYGVGHVPVSWQPGQDEIVVRAAVTGTLGSVGTMSCDAIDSTGEYLIPRPAISAAINDEDLSTLTVTIERRRTEVVKGMMTHGNLTNQTVQTEGWLELVTSSSESTTIQNCGTLSWCSGECVDTSYDTYNCGGCGITCLSTEYCSAGSCI